MRRIFYIKGIKLEMPVTKKNNCTFVCVERSSRPFRPNEIAAKVYIRSIWRADRVTVIPSPRQHKNGITCITAS
jgi:hypothetical protein